MKLKYSTDESRWVVSINSWNPCMKTSNEWKMHTMNKGFAFQPMIFIRHLVTL